MWSDEKLGVSSLLTHLTEIIEEMACRNTNQVVSDRRTHK